MSKYGTIMTSERDLFFCLRMSPSLTLGAWLSALFVWLIERLDRLRSPISNQ